MEETKKHGVTSTLEGAHESRVFRLSGLTCADCAAKLEKNIASLPGVESANLNFAAAKLTVEGDVAVHLIIEEARREGVTAAVEGTTPEQGIPFFEKNRRAVISVISGLFLAAGWVVDVLLQQQNITIGLYLAAMLTGGFATARKALLSLRRLDFNMNVLMTVAVTGAALIGEWNEGAAVAFLFSVSEALESYTIDKARQSIRSLIEIAPKVATIRRNGHEMELPVEEIQLGDVLLVRPGEKIAMDGKVMTGSSAVNQAAITGESIPVEKIPGDEVFAGTLNQQGFLEVKVTKLVNDTTIARIINMVEEAQARRAPSQAFVDRFARYYTPAVIALAAGITVFPPLLFGEPWSSWIYRGLALLVVACPCALVVSTPVAIVSAIGNAARNGVLIKGGVYLEEAGSLAVVAFDKTGTLTKGAPEVTDVIAAGGRVDEQKLLRVSASIEKMSEHPLAAAIVRKAAERGIEPGAVSDFEAIVGKGARAKLDGRLVIIGSPKLFEDMKLDLSSWDEAVYKLQSEGKTAMLVGLEGEIIGVVAVADAVRETGANAISRLKAAGIQKTVMLTGDNAATAGAIAKKVGVDHFMADLLPQDKVAAVNDLRQKYGKIAMIGDGVNDAPALATSTVGVAMGGAGTDTALETADIVLMADDLSKLPFAVRLSRAALKVIKQNIALSLAIKLAAVALVFPGWLTLWLAILADMGASVLVTLNGIRLMGVKSE
ncbi:MAG: heavy metal translocating P-type ATPase [Bacillota bacterium]